tara:strand:+ start:1767 stop:2018 length:252 start_codon:yes stop_codon:yes gene_type:complete
MDKQEIEELANNLKNSKAELRRRYDLLKDAGLSSNSGIFKTIAEGSGIDFTVLQNMLFYNGLPNVRTREKVFNLLIEEIKNEL